MGQLLWSCADIKTTMIYCHSSADTKREAVARVSRIYSRDSDPMAASTDGATGPNRLLQEGTHFLKEVAPIN
jgi:hypothetical protein